MSQPLLPQRQLLTARQVVAVLGILACLAFVVSYSGRIVMSMRLQGDLEQVRASVEEEKARQEQIRAWIASVDDPAVVEAYAREQRNLVRPGDQPVVTLPGQEAPLPETLALPEAEPAPPPNWRLWWDLLAPAAPAR